MTSPWSTAYAPARGSTLLGGIISEAVGAGVAEGDDVADAGGGRKVAPPRAVVADEPRRRR